MEQKTKVHAEDGKQELVITREFDLPVELLFEAYADPEIIEQWMGTKVLKWESKKHGSYQMETSDPKGNVAFRANGVIHEFDPNRKITRTFEMEVRLLASSLRSMNLNSLLTTPASSICMSYMSRLRKEIRY